MKPVLYILCGLPFSGKTTLANELVRRFGWVRVDLDQINSERGLGGKSNDEISDEDWAITYAESYRRVGNALAEGRIVINDTANFTRRQRDKLRAIGRKHGVISRVIYVNVADSVARQRWYENRLSKKRFDVRDEDFAEVADNFEPPSGDENVVYYDQTLPLDEWVAAHITACAS